MTYLSSTQLLIGQGKKKDLLLEKKREALGDNTLLFDLTAQIDDVQMAKYNTQLQLEGICLMLFTGAEGVMNGYFILLHYETFQSISIYLCTYYLLIILDYIAILARFFSLFLCKNM